MIEAILHLHIGLQVPYAFDPTAGKAVRESAPRVFSQATGRYAHGCREVMFGLSGGLVQKALSFPIGVLEHKDWRGSLVLGFLLEGVRQC